VIYSYRFIDEKHERDMTHKTIAAEEIGTINSNKFGYGIRRRYESSVLRLDINIFHIKIQKILIYDHVILQ